MKQGSAASVYGFGHQNDSRFATSFCIKMSGSLDLERWNDGYSKDMCKSDSRHLHIHLHTHTHTHTPAPYRFRKWSPRRHLNVKVFDAVEEPMVLLAELPVPPVAVASATSGVKEHVGDEVYHSHTIRRRRCSSSGTSVR